MKQGVASFFFGCLIFDGVDVFDWTLLAFAAVFFVLYHVDVRARLEVDVDVRLRHGPAAWLLSTWLSNKAPEDA